MNSHIPDPLINLGEARVPILASVRQSFCWMTKADWNDQPNRTDGVCDFLDAGRLKHLEEDDFAFITHSLGSRIVMDTLQYVATVVAEREAYKTLGGSFRDRSFPIFMLANQLPLLELGRKPAEVTGESDAYCRPDGAKYAKRLLGQTAIYAFSDPNDILSYGLPAEFVDRYIDSRLCPKATNIVLNVAPLISLFGMAEFANPGEAHGGYDHDARVVATIAHGFGHDAMAPIVKERCTWLETTSGS